MIKTFNFSYLVERLGEKNIIILGVSTIIILAIFLYLTVVVESYLQSGSKIRYGKYQVLIKDKNNNKVNKINIRAWNEANAVERVAKKLKSIDGQLFKVSKI